jgi:hypothetical protein
MSERNETQNPALLAVGCDPDVMIWRNQVGTFRAFDNPDRIVKIGTKGSADSIGVVAVTVTPEMVGRTIGVAIAAEFKTATGRQSPDQKAWQAAFEKRGGMYRVIRDESQMVEFVRSVKSLTTSTP